MRHTGLMLSKDGYVAINNSEMVSPEALTAEAWVKVWKPNFDKSATILSKHGSYELRFAPGKKISALFNIDGKNVEVLSQPLEWSNAGWYHVATTFNGKNRTLFKR